MKVLFVSLDTLRADRVFGPDRRPGLTPNLDRIASEGASFTNAFATDIPTTPSHTALFTGRFGADSGIVSHFYPRSHLANDVPWLPTMFHEAGFRTGAVDHLFAMKDWFIRGYDDYMAPPGRSRSPGVVINNLGFPWLTEHAGQDAFLFMHYWDSHIPYVPPSPFREAFTADSAGRFDPLTEQQLRSRPTYPLFRRNHYDHLDTIPNLEYLADLYDAEVAYLDHEIGRLFDHLHMLGGTEDTIAVLFGDHGENMTEHDHWFDHAGLYDSVVHVPLIIWAPGRVTATRTDALVALVDVLPTVTELTGLPIPNNIAGRSLLPLLNGSTFTHRFEIPLSECTWQAKRGLRTEYWKYVRCYHPGVYPRASDELYDLRNDPGEQSNVADKNPDLVTTFSARLDAWLAEQLGSRPDPMLAVIGDGLPAVKRLDRMTAGPDGAEPRATALVPVPPSAISPTTPSAPLVPVARPRARTWRARRRMVLATAVAVLAAVPFAVLVNSVFLDSPVSAAGAVEPLRTSQLDFSGTSPISSIDVKPGQTVQQGQALATQDASVADAKLASDHAKLVSDQAAMAQLGSPQTPSEVVQLQDKVDQAQTAVSSAQSALSDLNAVNGASLAGPQSAVQSAQATLSTDQQIFTILCPSSGNESSPVTCATELHQLTVDQNALSTAQATLTQVTATNQQSIDAARSTLTQAQAALSTAQSEQAVATQPATPATVASAQAAVAGDQAAIAGDQADIAQTVLKAPFTGIVTAVAGDVGDVASPQGVRQPSNSQPVTNPSSSGIQIFPQQTPPQAQTQPYASLITLDSPEAKIVAQVGESDIANIRRGQRADVTLPALSGSKLTATVLQIEPTAVNVSGSTYYLVDLGVSSPVSSTGQPPPVIEAASKAGSATSRHQRSSKAGDPPPVRLVLYNEQGKLTSSAALAGLSAEVTF
ncbi:MAG: sulfatase-like hydrolase/transferase [Acidimicrobiales bacterium]